MGDLRKISELGMELQNPTEDNFLKRIDWNKEELESAVKQYVADYKGVAYTEETMKQAKTDRADLNKLIKAINERKTEVKKTIMEPYTTFEAEVKEVLALIQEPCVMIDQQIKEYEEAKKKEKRETLEEYFNSIVDDLAEILSFDMVFIPQYLNVSFTLKKAKDEIKEKVEKVRTDLETIESLDSKYVLNVKDVYISTLDLSKALAENTRLQKLEEQMEQKRLQREREEQERKEREEEIARLQREQEQAVQEIPQPEPQPVQEQIAIPEVENKSEETVQSAEPVITKPEPKFRVRFQAIGTREQLKQLKEYMSEIGIEYGKVE